ncbi:MAG: hypothetical protein U0903_14055 [Planctomycetales bacterium]
MMCRPVAIVCVLFGFLVNHLPAGEEVTLLTDQFDMLPSGALSKVLWARAEYHYLPECAPKGPWSVTCYTSSIGSQRAWKIIDHKGQHALLQTYTPGADKHISPTLLAGDPLWQDYRIAVSFAPATERRSGVMFRVRNNRCYYFFGVEEGNAVLKTVQDELQFRKPLEKILAKQSFPIKPGRNCRGLSNCEGSTSPRL